MDEHVAWTQLGGGLLLPVAREVAWDSAAGHAALAAVLLHRAIGLLVPLTGGAVAYTILRDRRAKPGTAGR